MEPPTPEDTFALLRRYRDEGDRAALELIFERHYPRVERIVRIRLGPTLSRRTDAADIVQVTMLRALRELDQFEIREDARLVHWLAKIAEREVANRNTHDHAQKRDVAREQDLEGLKRGSEGGRLPFEPAADSTHVPDRVAQREMEEIVDRCLQELPERLREVILMREYAGGSWLFVAEGLGMPSEGAARQLYLRAREALKQLVKRHA